MRRLALLLALIAPFALQGCTAKSVYATDAEVSKAVYKHNGPPAITLYTMISNSRGSGAHTSMMINASQRVVFDPAGSVRHSAIPERNDVLFGITPEIEDFYERAHARSTYHVLVQRKVVSPEVAEQALRLALQAGPVPSAQCANRTSALLRQLPGFESIPNTWFPNKLSEKFGTLPGVTERRVYENDDDDKQIAIDAFKPET